jgi:hypothetical protein
MAILAIFGIARPARASLPEAWLLFGYFLPLCVTGGEVGVSLVRLSPNIGFDRDLLNATD